MLIKLSLVFAALSGGLGVALGAFGARALRSSLAPRMMETFQTAVQYQMIHALALLFVALLMQQHGRSLAFDVAALGMILGILLFSGSLYGLVLTEMRWLGPITPLGGVCFLVAWTALLVGSIQLVERP